MGDIEQRPAIDKVKRKKIQKEISKIAKRLMDSGLWQYLAPDLLTQVRRFAEVEKIEDIPDFGFDELSRLKEQMLVATESAEKQVAIELGITHEALLEKEKELKAENPPRFMHYLKATDLVTGAPVLDTASITEWQTSTLPTQPPKPGQADYTWNDVIDWYYRSPKDVCPTWKDLAEALGVSLSQIEKKQKLYWHDHGKKRMSNDLSKFTGKP